MAWESPRNVLASSAKASEFRITLGSCWCAWRVQKRLEKGERRVKKKSGNIDKSKGAGVLGVEARGEDSWTYQGTKCFEGGKREHKEVRDEASILYWRLCWPAAVTVCERGCLNSWRQLSAAGDFWACWKPLTNGRAPPSCSPQGLPQ